MAAPTKEMALQSWKDAYDAKKTEVEALITPMNIPQSIKDGLKFVWTTKTESSVNGAYMPNPDPAGGDIIPAPPAGDPTADGFHELSGGKWKLIWSIGNYAFDLVECGNQVSFGKSADN
jgi:hypothetical protein